MRAIQFAIAFSVLNFFAKATRMRIQRDVFSKPGGSKNEDVQFMWSDGLQPYHPSENRSSSKDEWVLRRHVTPVNGAKAKEFRWAEHLEPYEPQHVTSVTGTKAQKFPWVKHLEPYEPQQGAHGNASRIPNGPRLLPLPRHSRIPPALAEDWCPSRWVGRTCEWTALCALKNMGASGSCEMYSSFGNVESFKCICPEGKCPLEDTMCYDRENYEFMQTLNFKPLWSTKEKRGYYHLGDDMYNQ